MRKGSQVILNSAVAKRSIQHYHNRYRDEPGEYYKDDMDLYVLGIQVHGSTSAYSRTLLYSRNWNMVIIKANRNTNTETVEAYPVLLS